MSGLLRWQIFAGYGVALLSVWYCALSAIQTQPNIAAWQRKLVEYLPVWAILLLGLYAGLSVLYGVANFRDCPEAAAEIEQQVIQARKELKRRGIIS